MLNKIFEDEGTRPLGKTWDVRKVATIALIRALYEIINELENRVIAYDVGTLDMPQSLKEVKNE